MKTRMRHVGRRRREALGGTGERRCGDTGERHWGGRKEAYEKMYDAFGKTQKGTEDARGRHGRRRRKTEMAIVAK